MNPPTTAIPIDNYLAADPPNHPEGTRLAVFGECCPHCHADHNLPFTPKIPLDASRVYSVQSELVHADPYTVCDVYLADRRLQIRSVSVDACGHATIRVEEVKE